MSLETLIFEWLKISDNKINRFDIGGDEKITKKLKKIKKQKIG